MPRYHICSIVEAISRALCQDNAALPCTRTFTAHPTPNNDKHLNELPHQQRDDSILHAFIRLQNTSVVMAPQKKRENRENQFYNVGVQGR